jgi:hypothetical protein
MHYRLKACLRLAAGGALVAMAGLASGCISSPTYGTDKTANAQLLEDLEGIASFSDKRRTGIDYSPRPDLVKPAKGDTTLPVPQQSVASADNPNWPESPEERLARIRAEADENADDPSYVSPVEPDLALKSKGIEKGLGQAWRDFEAGNDPKEDRAAEKAEYERRLKESKQGDPATRKYLSEPPVEYRQAAADAPQGDPGEDEDDKTRRLKREARKKAGKSGFDWDDLNPF